MPLAALSQADPTDLAELAQYGVLGIVVVAMLVGWLIPGPTHRRETDRADRLETELRSLRERTEERVIPLVTRALDLIERPQDGGHRWRDRASSSKLDAHEPGP